MSYMNDDCDPFGIPYVCCDSNNDTNDDNGNMIQYSLEDYDTLLQEKNETRKNLKSIEKKIDDAENSIVKQINDICKGVVTKVEFKNEKLKIVISQITVDEIIKLKDKLNVNINIQGENGYLKLYIRSVIHNDI